MELKGVSPSELADFKLPPQCVNFFIKAKQNADGCTEECRQELVRVARVFEIPEAAYGEMVLIAGSGGRRIELEIKPPKSDGRVGFRASCGEGLLPEEFRNTLGLNNCFDSSWEPLPETDGDVSDLTFRKNYGRHSVKWTHCGDAETASEVVAEVILSPCLDQLVFVDFRYGVGWLDVTEVMDPEVPKSLIRAVVNGACFDQYTISVRWLEDIDWEGRDEIRERAQSEYECREILGSVEIGGVGFEVSMVYGNRGYSFEVRGDGLGEVTGDGWNALAEDLRLTA